MTRKATAALLTVLVMVAMPLFADKKEKSKEKDKGKTKIEKSEKKQNKVSTKKIARINSDVNRLETILVTARDSAIAFPKPTLTKVANEANSLANRIWADVRSAHMTNTEALAVARDLRMHVREMHKAAASGNAAGVRLHAGQALSFATRLDGMV
jgi:hypothetical protein